MAQTVKNLPAMRENLGSILGLGRSPGEEHGNPAQYSCLENPRDKGARRATVTTEQLILPKFVWLIIVIIFQLFHFVYNIRAYS